MPGDDSAGDKTEEATPRRREQERERGQVPKSRDLGAALSLLGAILLLKYGGHTIAWLMVDLVEDILGENGMMATSFVPDHLEIMPLVFTSLWWFSATTLPILVGVFFVAALANYGQVGFLIAPQALEPNLNKINPVSGFQRMFSLRSIITLLMSLAKVALMVAVAWPMIRTEMDNVVTLSGQDTNEIFLYLVDAVLRVALKLACLLIILGILDYAYQRYQQNEDMKMTKQQVKEEYKDTEGSPEVKAKRRQMQREIAQKRMMSEVPDADVVIRNPTHFAIAIKYNLSATDGEAPKVVAKGKDNLALKIIEIAKEHRVFIWHEPPLARRLYRDVEVGEEIPAELFKAVAMILSRAYMASGKKVPFADEQTENAARTVLPRAG